MVELVLLLLLLLLVDVGTDGGNVDDETGDGVVDRLNTTISKIGENPSSLVVSGAVCMSGLSKIVVFFVSASKILTWHGVLQFKHRNRKHLGRDGWGKVRC